MAITGIYDVDGVFFGATLDRLTGRVLEDVYVGSDGISRTYPMELKP